MRKADIVERGCSRRWRRERSRERKEGVEKVGVEGKGGQGHKR